MSAGLNFSRILKYGFLNLWRYRWLSATAIAVMVISLLATSSLLVLNQLASFSAQDLRDRVDVSLFFSSDVSEEKIMDIKTEFENLQEVKAVKYISSEQALADFKESHKDDPLIQKSLAELEQNPLQPSLVVMAKDLTLYPVIVQQIQNSRFQPLIEKINYDDSQGLIDTLQRVTSGLRNFGILFASVFGLVSILVMFNTLRLTIFSRREEIEIMRLVGASNGYIRGPFLVEGILYGLAGSLIATLVLYPVLLTSVPGIKRFFGLDLPFNSFLTGGFWILLLIQTGLGVLLGVVSSLIATKRHLNI